MRNTYFTPKTSVKHFLLTFFLLAVSLTSKAQVRIDFTQRASQYTPTKKIYNVKGDFTMIGNTNLTRQSYSNTENNNNTTMVYVDVDGNSTNGVDGKPTFNSSSADLTFSTENGATPSCSNIVYAGLYWTGKASSDNASSSPETFSLTRTISGTSYTKSFNKRQISFKGPGASSYTQFTAASSNIYYPLSSDAYIYSAYVEVTDYVRQNGLGTYTAADIAVRDGNGGNTGYSGGWGLIVVYENTKMKYRDVTIFDGHAFVLSSNSNGNNLPVSGFNTVQTGNVGVKLGIMASEGDVNLTGDYLKIQKLSSTQYLDLSHTGNSTTNFFNSSINTGGNTRNPNLQNNTGIDISMFNLPNAGNAVIGNNQTQTNFIYGTSGDTYAIFAIAMSVDAYKPEAESIITATTINNVPVTSEPYVALPNEEIGFNVDVRNLGTEAINNFKVVVPIPYNASYVPGSANATALFTPLPSPNNVYFDANLGATGSVVWDMGTLPLPANPSVLLGKLRFKLTATTNCSILLNPTCGSPIYINGSTNGTGATTGISFSGARAIKGYSQNGNCTGQPIPETLAIGINGANYVASNCINTPVVQTFGFCQAGSTIGTTQLAPNFPPGSMFYNEFPVTVNSIQYSDVNPIPLVAGSTVTYYAVPPNTTGCTFPFIVTKCKLIDAKNDTFGSINGTTGNNNIGNIFNNNGSGSDTLDNVQTNLSQVNLSIVTPATAINGGQVPYIDLATGNVVVPAGTSAGTYTITYKICEKTAASNCDTAVVTITCPNPVINAVNDTISGGNGANGNPNAGNVLATNGNGPDTLNGTPVTIAQVNMTVTTAATPINNGPVPSIDVTTGQVSIPAGTPAGNYTIVYQICEKLNPSNCDSATVTINVTAPAIDAVNDTILGGNGANGNPNAGNVLATNGNGPDTLNGTPVTIAQVNMTVTTAATPINNGPVPSIDVTTGQVSI
ncbi:hypothetical protein KIH23_04620, partial [Flavobacterium sp. CYK-55]|uniref:hypothetical protein n=1 Tax=Flavobacterium sp. CYK-55 TaxID=2835529 RepID=UPI001BCB768F